MRQQLAEPELTEWDRYAREEYARLAMEEDLNQDLELDEEEFDEDVRYHLEQEEDPSMDIDPEEECHIEEEEVGTTRSMTAEAPF